MIQDVRCGDLPQGQGAVCLQGYNSLLRLREQERREEGGHISPEDFSRLTEAVVELVTRHLPETARLRAFSEDVAQLLDASG